MKYINLILLFILMSCSGTPPELGVKEGRLTLCPDKPNCVVSYNNSEDHYIDPIKFMEDKETAYQKLSTILEKEKNSKIITKNENYIRAEFTSAIFGFVDDLEFLFPNDEEKTIHVRSSSRIGHSDLGVNRKRVEMIRFKYTQNDY